MYNSFFKTKLCLLLASVELALRQEGSGIIVTQADPGPFKSNLVRDVPLAGWVKNLISSHVDMAAGNILFVMTSDEVKKKSGTLFVKKQERPLTTYWLDTHIRERLWSITEKLIDKYQFR